MERKSAKTGWLIEEVIEHIEESDDYEMSIMIEAMIRRYAAKHADWELMLLFARKDPEKRKQDIETHSAFSKTFINKNDLPRKVGGQTV